MPQQIYTVELDGKQYDLQGDHPPSEAEARAAISSYAPPKATPPPASATIGMMQPSTASEKPAQPFGSLGIQSVSDADWSKLSPQQKMVGVLQAAGKAIGFGTQPFQEAVDNPKTTLAMAAASAVPGVIAKALPNAASAGAKIEAATQAAGDVPINPEGVGTAGLRAVELQQAGGSMPRVASRLMERITNPDAGDLTFQEARDYYSNLSRVSANEFNRMNPTMQRAVGEMRAALHTALTDAANTVGAGEQYQSGISEYAKAAKLAQAWDKAKPVLARELFKIGGLGAAYEGLRRVTK